MLQYQIAQGRTLDELAISVNALIAQGYELSGGEARYTLSERNGVWTREMRLPVPGTPVALPPPLTLSADTKTFLQSLILSIAVVASPSVVQDVRIVNTKNDPVITNEKSGNP